MPGAGEPEWIDFEEFETSDSVSETWPSDYFESIGVDYLAAGRGQKGNVGASQSFLFGRTSCGLPSTGWTVLVAQEEIG